jgi:hypothetical protein
MADRSGSVTGPWWVVHVETTMSDATRPKHPDQSGQPPPSRMARIAQRAHEIYEARGGQEGKAIDDWLQAEREIDAEMEAADGGKSS